MKFASACTLFLVLSSNVWGQFSIIRHFDDELQFPRSTGIYEGSVYGFTDLYSVSSDLTEPVASLFSFDLDGTNLRSRNVIYEVGGFATGEPGRGPLTIQDGVIYATQDLGATFTAPTSSLVPTRGPIQGFNWMNPIIVNGNMVAGAGFSEPYGIRFEPLSGMPALNVGFAEAPVQSITTDGNRLFASNAGFPNPTFQGKLVRLLQMGFCKRSGQVSPVPTAWLTATIAFLVSVTKGCTESTRMEQGLRS